jgi:glycosyltransferase involved in cell wall biosynthesis
MTYNVAIDARMIEASGIGALISAAVPRIIASHPEWKFKIVCGAAAQQRYGWLSAANVSLIPFESPIYGINEQIHWPTKKIDDCDLLWVPHYNIPLKWKGKLLVTVHDLAHLALPDIFKGFASQFYARLMFKAVFSRADQITFVSQFSCNEFERIIGPPKQPVQISHSGVDDWWIQPDGQAYDIPQQPYFLYVGNVKPHKNLSRLVSGFSLARNDIPQNLLIVGERNGLLNADHAVQKEAAALGDRVHFTGKVSNEHLRALYRSATALVLPSIYEGFGLPPLEAMAAGCPVAVSKAASLPEVYGDTALYFDPYDPKDIARALRVIGTNEAVRKHLLALAPERVRILSWDATAQRYGDQIATMLHS